MALAISSSDAWSSCLTTATLYTFFSVASDAAALVSAGALEAAAVEAAAAELLPHAARLIAINTAIPDFIIFIVFMILSSIHNDMSGRCFHKPARLWKRKGSCPNTGTEALFDLLRYHPT